MSNNIGKYITIGIGVGITAGVVALGISIKRNFVLVTSVIDLEQEFDMIFAEHGADGRAELIRRYHHKTRNNNNAFWKKTYLENLLGSWDKYVANKATSRSNDEQPDA